MCHSLYTFLEWKGFLEKFILFKIFVWSLSEWVQLERNDFNSFCIRDIWIKDWAEIRVGFQKKWKKFKTYVIKHRTPTPGWHNLWGYRESQQILKSYRWARNHKFSRQKCRKFCVLVTKMRFLSYLYIYVYIFIYVLFISVLLIPFLFYR